MVSVSFPAFPFSLPSSPLPHRFERLRSTKDGQFIFLNFFINSFSSLTVHCLPNQPQSSPGGGGGSQTARVVVGVIANATLDACNESSYSLFIIETSNGTCCTVIDEGRVQLQSEAAVMPSAVSWRNQSATGSMLCLLMEAVLL